jgi:hypothetical protein
MNAEYLGLAAYVVTSKLLNELEATHPGIKERVIQVAIADQQADGGVNGPKIIEAIETMKR